VKDPTVRSLLDLEADITEFDPHRIAFGLAKMGFRIANPKEFARAPAPTPPDEDIVILESALRLYFLATEINESTFQKKLGKRFSRFKSHVIPALLKGKIVQPVQYEGGGQQRRFKLMIKMDHLKKALSLCEGKFDKLVNLLSD
jgi:hypothetical protein